MMINEISNNEGEKDITPVEEIDFTVERALIAAETTANNTPVSFNEIGNVPYKNDIYTYSGEEKYRCVFSQTDDYPEFKYNLIRGEKVTCAWYFDDKIFFLTVNAFGLSNSMIYAVNPGHNKACAKYALAEERAHSDSKMYGLEDKSILFLLNGSCYLLKNNNFQKLFKHSMYFCELVYCENDLNGNISYLLFGRNIDNIEYIYDSGNFINAEDCISKEVRVSFCAMIKSKIALKCPEYLHYDLLHNADCSFDSRKNALIFTTNCRKCVETEDATLVYTEETNPVFGDFEPYSLMFARDCNQYFYLGEEFVSKYTFSDYEKEELPDYILDATDFVFCLYVESAIKHGNIGMIPSKEEFRSKIYWWSTSFVLDGVAVCAFAMHGTNENDSFRCFGHLASEDGKTVLKIARTLAELEAGKVRTVKSIFSDKQRKTVAKRDAFLDEMRQKNYLLLDPLAKILTSYMQKVRFDSGNTDYLHEEVSAEIIAEKIYCVYVMTDVSFAYIADLSKYGLGKSEIISYDFRNNIEVRIKRDGVMVPLEPASLPDPSMVIGFIPTLNNRSNFKITGASKHKSGKKLHYLIKDGGEGVETCIDFYPQKDVYDNFSFYIKYQNGFLEHPLFNNIYAYCLLRDGIIVANSSGVYVICENAAPVKAPVEGINLRDVLEIHCNNGIIELELFDKLSGGYEEDVLLQDYHEAVRATYYINTHTVRISM